MRNWILAVFLFLFVPVLHAQQNAHGYTLITTEELVAWYEENEPMILLNASSKDHLTGKLLPASHWVAYNSDEARIREYIPARDSLIVVYCNCGECPSSGLLADRLIKMGYTNVYRYPDGLKGWKKAGLPLEDQN